MLIDLLINNLWLSLGLWVILYISDYYLTIYAARLYQSGVNKHIVYEKGIELTPYYQKDIASLKLFSLRFILMLLLSCLSLMIVWIITAKQTPVIFEFFIGAFILGEISIHMRHVRNLVIFKYMKYSKGVRGTLEYTKWFSYRVSAIELLEFAILFLFIFFLSNRLFFLGGSIDGLITAIKHWRLAKKERLTVQNIPENPIK
jgi:hypothetical protein